MFKFTIRELLLLTLVVGLGAGWMTREQKLRSELKEANRWRTRAGALEKALTESDRKVMWYHNAANEPYVWVQRANSDSGQFIMTGVVEPSEGLDGDWPSATVPNPPRE